MDEELRRILNSYAKKIYYSIGKRVEEKVVTPVHISSYEDFRKMLEEHEVVVADFWAEWCAPCQIYSQMFEEAAKKLEGKALFVKVNVDENPEIAYEYGVMSVPTTIIFVNGKPVDWIVGAVPEYVLEGRVKRFIRS